MSYAERVLFQGENPSSKLLLELLLVEYHHYGGIVRDNAKTPSVNAMSELLVDAPHYSKAPQLLGMILSLDFRLSSARVRNHMFGTRGVALYKNHSHQ